MKKLSILQKIVVAVALLVGAQFCANATSLQAGISNDALTMNIDQNIVGPLSVDAGYLYNYHDDHNLATAGAHLDFGLGPVGAMVGAKYFYADIDGQDGRGLAPGIGLNFSPLPLLTLSAQYYYSNQDYSTGDIEHYRDWSLTANFHPLKITNFYVGYGQQVVDTKKYGNVNVYDGVFGGVSVSF